MTAWSTASMSRLCGSVVWPPARRRYCTGSMTWIIGTASYHPARGGDSGTEAPGRRPRKLLCGGRAGCEGLGERGDRHRAARARLVHHRDGEAVLGVVRGVEEEDVVVARREHTAQAVGQLVEGHLGGVHRDRARGPNVQDERWLGVLLDLILRDLFLLLLR